MKVVFQPSIFRCYVSFREGKLAKDANKHEKKRWLAPEKVCEKLSNQVVINFIHLQCHWNGLCKAGWWKGIVSAIQTSLDVIHSCQKQTLMNWWHLRWHSADSIITFMANNYLCPGLSLTKTRDLLPGKRAQGSENAKPLPMIRHH